MPKVYTVADIKDNRPLADKQALVAEWNATEAGRATKEWQEKMALSDATLPRYVEDIIDKVGTAGLAEGLVSKYAAKKALRAERP
jgi:hypothetical protein